jgi:hypothetical protein
MVLHHLVLLQLVLLRLVPACVRACVSLTR